MGPLFFSSKSHVKSLNQIWIYLILHPVLNKKLCQSCIYSCAKIIFPRFSSSSNLSFFFFLRSTPCHTIKASSYEGFFNEEETIKDNIRVILWHDPVYKVWPEFLFPRTTKKKKTKVEKNDSRTFSCSELLSLPLLSVLLFFMMTCLTVSVWWFAFSYVEWLPVTVNPPFCN